MVSVSKLIDILNKPALLRWANRIGLDGVDLKNYKKQVTSNGIDKHKLVEDYLLNGVVFNGSDRLDKCLLGYEVVSVEQEITNGKIIGRVDLILKKDDLIYICDFKSGKNIYLSTKLQLSTYKHIYGADKICFINLDDFIMKEITIETKDYFDIIKRLYQVYELLKKTKEKL